MFWHVRRSLSMIPVRVGGHSKREWGHVRGMKPSVVNTWNSELLYVKYTFTLTHDGRNLCKVVDQANNIKNIIQKSSPISHEIWFTSQETTSRFTPIEPRECSKAGRSCPFSDQPVLSIMIQDTNPSCSFLSRLFFSLATPNDFLSPSEQQINKHPPHTIRRYLLLFCRRSLHRGRFSLSFSIHFFPTKKICYS